MVSSQPTAPRVQLIIDEIMRHGTYVLKPSQTKLTLTLLGCSIFTLMGIWIIKEGDEPLIGWLAVGFFGIGGLCLVIQILRGKGSYISLSQEGLTMHGLDRPYLFRWTDIDGFSIGVFSGAKLVMFDFSDSYKCQSTYEKILESMEKGIYKGRIGAFPDVYGLNPEEMVDLLNTLRKHFLHELD